MNCDLALELMLEADLAEMSGAMATPLGQHLRACAKCRGVGAHLVESTERFASLMATPVGQGARRVRRVYESAPVALAAGILVMFAMQVRQQAVPNLPNVLPAIVVTGTVPPPTEEVSRAPIFKTVAAAVRAAPVTSLRAFPVARPIAAVELAPTVAGIATTSLVVASNVVSVTPPAGSRAVVMQTGDPKLVVVWLYDPEESR
jgi:hypothetical protein